MVIDILLASYNGALYIKEQIKSIIAQTNKEWRLWIHDDCSSDNTMAVAAEAAEGLYCHGFDTGATDANCSIVIRKNARPYGNAAGNFIGLLEDASAEYAMFCDQDDVWHPDKIEKTLALMKKMEKRYGKDVPLLVYTDLAVVSDKLEMIDPSFIHYMKIPQKITLNRLLIQNSVTGCTIMMNRTLYEYLRRVKSTDKILMHDHFAALIAAAFGKIGFVPEATMDYRQHGNNSVGAANARSLAYLWGRYRRGKKQFRRDLYNSMVQAGYFYQLYGDYIKDEKKKQLIYEYSQLTNRNKWQRMRFYWENHALKYGWLRAVMQIIWG